MLRKIGSLDGTLAGKWNLDFTNQRRDNMRRTIRYNLRCNPKGKGNKAWKRYEAILRDPSCLVWPNYAA